MSATSRGEVAGKHPEALLLGVAALILLTPKPLAHLLQFHTHTMQALAFCTIGIAAVLGARGRLAGDFLAAAASRSIAVVLGAGLLELLQPLVNRGAHLADFGINAGAVAAGAMVAVLGRVVIARPRRPSQAWRDRASAGSHDLSVPAEQRRWFVVSAGRTGSTLLAAILADAGGQFGMAPPASWDRGGGDMEHPRLTQAAHLFAAAQRLSVERPRGAARLRWTLLRSRAKRLLASALDEVLYVKVAGAHNLVRPAFKLGYFPTVIVSYRRFEDFAVSLGLIHANASLDSLKRQYQQSLWNGLWLLNTFGGCVIGYDELVDVTDRSWAGPLSQATGISVAALVAARDRRLDLPSARVVARHTEAEAAEAFAAAASLREQWVPPSAQALRSWRSRFGARRSRGEA